MRRFDLSSAERDRAIGVSAAALAEIGETVKLLPQRGIGTHTKDTLVRYRVHIIAMLSVNRPPYSPDEWIEWEAIECPSVDAAAQAGDLQHIYEMLTGEVAA